jgi:hypothetical protein
LIPVFDHYTPQSFKLHLILSCRWKGIPKFFETAELD